MSESVHSDGPDMACAPPSHDDTVLLGKYVKTDDNTSYDFSCSYSKWHRPKCYMLGIHGVNLTNDEVPNPKLASYMGYNTACFNGVSTFVKLDEDSFQNLKTTLVNNTGFWKDSIFPGKWFTDEGYEEYKKKMSRRYSCVAAHYAARGLGYSGSNAGSSRKSKRIHRKPTKRRRNRRGNRKTKKN